MPRLFFLPALLLTGLVALGQADQPFRYAEGKHGPAELRHVQGIPVLSVAGTPEEIAEQMSRLTLKSSGRLLNYPKDVLGAFYPQGNVAGIKRETGLNLVWRGLLTVGEG